MGKLGFILGGVALAATGYGIKKWYDKTKEENAYWTDEPQDIACEMLKQATEKVYNVAEAVEDKFYNVADIVEDKFFNESLVTTNLSNKKEVEEKSKQEEIE
ncbi:hypothetical protein CINS5955_07165 [Campylobacter insulaenigrae]|uniref:hypothetical protein n=1 Tax=Campylobacter insulaenigrae TaxID=260714 RepID=UPI0021539429|nr:hypothetical protein [Campylobacter insulaenigrae]MCR6579217.1 hypothetical protein [Campylobacter insulaenigrae]